MTDIVMWAIVAFLALATILTVTSIGEERKPITPGLAAGTLVVQSLIIVGILYVGGAL